MPVPSSNTAATNSRFNLYEEHYKSQLIVSASRAMNHLLSSSGLWKCRVEPRNGHDCPAVKARDDAWMRWKEELKKLYEREDPGSEREPEG